MKDNMDDIKKLWIKQPIPVANQSEIFKAIGKFRRKRIMRTIILNTILLFTICFVLFVWIYFNPQLVCTKIGIILTIIPIGIVIIFNHKLFSLYKKTDKNKSNSDYLNNLIKIKSRENILYTKVMNLYFVLLSIGIGLYIYEYTFKVSFMFGIFAYFLVLSWICVNWFFLRPRIIRKNKQKTDCLIEQVEKLRSQLAEHTM